MSVADGNPSMHCRNGQSDSFKAQPHCWEAVGSGSPARYCHTTGEQWAMGHL